MSAKRRPIEIMIVGDTPAFGTTVGGILGGRESILRNIRTTTYDGFRAILSPRLIRETDLFILEIWRTYTTGLRAEGLAVAEELFRLRALALVVSPLTIAEDADLPFYWDPSSPVDLSTKCAELLQSKNSTHRPGKFDPLEALLTEYLSKPMGHDSESAVSDC